MVVILFPMNIYLRVYDDDGHGTSVVIIITTTTTLQPSPSVLL